MREEEWHRIQADYRLLSEHQKGEFSMFAHMLSNKLKYYVPTIPERGNCTYWTSKSMAINGLLRSPSNFPLACFYQLLLNIKQKRTHYFKNNDSSDNFAIVSYKSLQHDHYPKGSLVYPFYWMKHTYGPIWRIENLSHLTVALHPQEADANTYQIVVKENDPEHQQKYMDKMLKITSSIFRG
jgi:hypothetical protein